jgi:vacuolar protein-sorting-associated protein 4
MFTPCLPHDQGAILMNWRKVDPSQLLEPPLSSDDFFKVLQGVKPSVSEVEIKKCHEWTQQFGLEGA